MHLHFSSYSFNSTSTGSIMQLAARLFPTITKELVEGEAAKRL